MEMLHGNYIPVKYISGSSGNISRDKVRRWKNPTYLDFKPLWTWLVDQGTVKYEVT